MGKLATLGDNGIVCVNVRADVEAELADAHVIAKHEYGQFEAVVLQVGDEYNLQLHMEPDRTFLSERILKSSTVSDFNDAVKRKFSHPN